MNNISLAILWHFHQPVYSRPGDKILPLPWVRFHSIKDYLDMLLHLKKYPDIQVTFNFTPSLLLQIDDYRNNRCQDRQFVLFRKRADELTLEEKVEILKDFFLANWEKMVEPYPRYFSLLLKRGKKLVIDELPAVAQSFTTEEFRDLQVWSNLVWIDPIFRNEIKELYQRGKNFKEQDKDLIIKLQNKIINRIIDEYKKTKEDGQIELTTSPFAHPILPLLINSNVAKISNPNLNLPFEFQHPEDARQQVLKGIEIFEKYFGFKPSGFWPSEGGVSAELLPILVDAGIEWIATDEEILARSINLSFKRDENGVPNHANLLYKPWQMENIKIFFRDHLLSDQIAFVYNRCKTKDAIKDFMERIRQIGRSLSPYEKFIIPVILDGENAWEYFHNDGTEFIEGFYNALSTERIITTTFHGFLQNYNVENTLSNLFPGSWIGANFNIWIGQNEDQKAWQIVKNLRDKLVEKNITDEKIWERFYLLQGSDWFWWFGDEFFSVTTEVFDELFRQNALWIYKMIGEEPPHELFIPICPRAEVLATQPLDRISPKIDGKLTFYYEWYNAGYFDMKRMGGTMQRFAGLFSGVYYGFDEKNLYIRFDVSNQDPGQYEFEIEFHFPQKMKIELKEGFDIIYKIDEIGEVAIPLSILNIGSEDGVEFVIKARLKGIEVDRTPLLKLTLAQKEIILRNWTV
uniref:Glycoside hydrolase family 57 N-terminal domain-containing protein n=1 Tax=candidate division WOR-3 bacterium TaxID=2052148 RepID=A0A7C4XJF4_UNCW3